MNKTKLFFMAALALIFAACSNDDDELLQQPVEQPTTNMIHITAKLAPKSNDAQTRAVDDKGDGKITVDWAKDEQLKIIGDGGEEATANIDAVDASGVATISFDISNTAKDKDCIIIYPYDAAVTETAGVYTANPILSQNGTLNASLDVRIGEGHITLGDPPTLEVTTQPAPQFSIFKFTIQDLSATAKTATQFRVCTSSGTWLTTVDPGSATGTFYVALPVLAAGTYWFRAKIDDKLYQTKATVGTATEVGKYYQTTLKMATIGNVIGTDGKFYVNNAATPGGNTAVAMIAYIFPSGGLALALSDEEGKMTWDAAKTACENKTPTVPGCTWQLATENQWVNMISACKNVLGTNNNYKDLRDCFSSVGGTNMELDKYWSSTSANDSQARFHNFSTGVYGGQWGAGSKTTAEAYVRACLAF